jgi:hypothetical protein
MAALRAERQRHQLDQARHALGQVRLVVRHIL